MKHLLASLLLILSTALPVFAATPGEIAEGHVLRDLPMRGLTGESRQLASFFGKPLIINVWASYCSPCLAEMGSLDRLAKRYGEHFNVIGVSIDDYDERAQAFLARAGTSFPHFIDHELAIENMLGANRIPLTVIVDAQGRILHKVYGVRDWDSDEAVRAISRAFDLQL